MELKLVQLLGFFFSCGGGGGGGGCIGYDGPLIYYYLFGGGASPLAAPALFLRLCSFVVHLMARILIWNLFQYFKVVIKLSIKC